MTYSVKLAGAMLVTATLIAACGYTPTQRAATGAAGGAVVGGAAVGAPVAGALAGGAIGAVSR